MRYPALLIVLCVLSGCAGWHPLYTLAPAPVAPTSDPQLPAGAAGWRCVVNDPAGGTVSPAIGTGSPGAALILTATPASGWAFDHWEPDRDLSSSGGRAPPNEALWHLPAAGLVDHPSAVFIPISHG